MATEAQKATLAKARATKLKKVEPVTEPHSVVDEGHTHAIHFSDAATIHREISAAAEAVYHSRKLFINVAYVPACAESVAHTVFGGVPVRPSTRKELVLSNGETISFDQAV